MELPEYFEKFMISQFETVHQKLDAQIQLQKIANGRTTKNEERIEKLETWMAQSQGTWSGVNKTLTILWIITAFIGGAIVTYLWH